MSVSMDQGPTSPSLGRRSRAFSYRSDKSGGSGTKGKVDLTESPSEKARRDSIWKDTSKANPNAALNEAQPGVRNLNEETTLASLREFQHKDAHGNPIVDPDLSNPTRPRLERPLDTIRSFEKAIDQGYKRRSSYRAESYDQSNQYASRRSSYLGGKYMQPDDKRRSYANGPSAGYDNGPSPARNNSQMGGGYYGDRRPESYMSGHNGPPRMRYNGQRMASDPGMHQRPYPQSQHNHHQSADTMATGVTNGSDSTGPWASGTDPSSENSSIDKSMGVNGNGNQSGYAHGGYNPPIMEDQVAGSYGQGGYGGPVQAPPPARRPIALGNSGGGSLPTQTRPEPEKKKGWLKRTFSKKA